MAREGFKTCLPLAPQPRDCGHTHRASYTAPWIQIQVLMLARQTLHRLSHLPKLPSTPNFKENIERGRTESWSQACWAHRILKARSQRRLHSLILLLPPPENREMQPCKAPGGHGAEPGGFACSLELCWNSINMAFGGYPLTATFGSPHIIFNTLCFSIPVGLPHSTFNLWGTHIKTGPVQ